MFASQMTKDVTLKNNVTVTIQKASGATLENARIQRTLAQAETLKAFGGDVVKALRSEALEEAAKVLAATKGEDSPEKRLEKQRRARYDEYDRQTLLMACIRRWSCQRETPLNPKAIADLTDEDAQHLHEEIVDHTLPPIDPEAAAAVPKGD